MQKQTLRWVSIHFCWYRSLWIFLRPTACQPGLWFADTKNSLPPGQSIFHLS